MSYNGLPIVQVDEDNVGNQILPVLGAQPRRRARQRSTSIYVLSLGDRALTGIQNGVVETRDLGSWKPKPVMRTRVEWFFGTCDI